MMDPAKLSVDPFPELKNAFTRMYMNYAFNALKTKFNNDEKEFMKFLVKFNDSLELSKFLQKMVFYNCGKQTKNTHLRLMSLISTIESLSLERSHMDMWAWLVSKVDKIGRCGCCRFFLFGDFKEKMDSLRKEYNNNYGASNKFRMYLRDNLSTKSKLVLIRGFEKYSEDSKPKSQCFCFKDCEYKYGSNEVTHMHCDRFICRLENNTVLTNKFLDKVTNILYGMRSTFAHNAQFTGLSLDEDVVLCTHKGKSISVHITMPQLEQIFEEAIVTHYTKKFTSKSNNK